MNYNSYVKRGVIAALSSIALAGAALSTAAVAQDVTRVIVGTPPPPDGEGNNPNRDITANDSYQLHVMYEHLIGVDPKTSEWVPQLAESWELNEAGNALTFKLRKGVQFHNGFGEFTAKDVVFSIDDHIDPPGAVAGTPIVIRDAVKEFEIVDDHTLVFHLTAGVDLDFFEGISYGAAGAEIRSSADWASRGGGKPASPKLDEAPVAGTGPYQFVERNPGRNVIFKKVPWDHWRQNGDFEELEIRFIAEDATRMSALLAGEIHLTQLPEELTQEAARRGMEIIRTSLPGRRYGLALAGCDWLETPDLTKESHEVYVSGKRRDPNSPWCDVDIRRAASKGIDREALNVAFFGGEAEISKMWYWLPEQTDSWNPEWDTRFDEHLGYDPEAACKLLEGKPAEQKKIRILASGDIPEAIANMLNDACFDAELWSVERGTYLQMQRNREIGNGLEFDDTASENITGVRPALWSNHRSGRGYNTMEFDNLYRATVKELDPEKRATMWRELGDMVFNDAYHIPLLRSYSKFVADPKVVCGYTNPGANLSDPFAFLETIEKCS